MMTTETNDTPPRETLEQYADRIVAATRRALLDRLDDDVIGFLGKSHLIFGKACAVEAISTAMKEAPSFSTSPEPPARHLPSREEIAAIVASNVRLEWHGHDHASINPRSVTAAADAILSLLRGDTANGGEG